MGSQNSLMKHLGMIQNKISSMPYAKKQNILHD